MLKTLFNLFKCFVKLRIMQYVFVLDHLQYVSRYIMQRFRLMFSNFYVCDGKLNKSENRVVNKPLPRQLHNNIQMKSSTRIAHTYIFYSSFSIQHDICINGCIYNKS